MSHDAAYEPVNKLTHVMMYHCLATIYTYFAEIIDMRKLQNLLAEEITHIDVGSFVRPYILGLICRIKQHEEKKKAENERMQSKSSMTDNQ